MILEEAYPGTSVLGLTGMVSPFKTSTYDSWKCPVHTVALGLTKAMHELLTLHYFATDSASSWDNFLTEHIPIGTWPPADERRQGALDMFEKCHICTIV